MDVVYNTEETTTGPTVVVITEEIAAGDIDPLSFIVEGTTNYLLFIYNIIHYYIYIKSCMMILLHIYEDNCLSWSPPVGISVPV